MFEVMARLKIRDGELDGFKADAVAFRRFSLLQGLEVDLEARDEVTA
jgi:hypothetical protein